MVWKKLWKSIIFVKNLTNFKFNFDKEIWQIPNEKKYAPLSLVLEDFVSFFWRGTLLIGMYPPLDHRASEKYDSWSISGGKM